jgi:hypothetical protein
VGLVGAIALYQHPSSGTCHQEGSVVQVPIHLEFWKLKLLNILHRAKLDTSVPKMMRIAKLLDQIEIILAKLNSKYQECPIAVIAIAFWIVMGSVVWVKN